MLKETLMKTMFYLRVSTVLILILMEHAQRECSIFVTKGDYTISLNPYFNGTCSKSQ